jgi:tetratricopeptide (TPR) repeat protein
MPHAILTLMLGPGMGASFRAWRSAHRNAAWIACFALFTVGVGGGRAAAATDSFWERVAGAERSRPGRLASEAEALLGSQPRSPEKLARAEALVREALSASPDDFGALMLLAEVSARASRPAATLAALERACARAPRGPAASSCWFHLGVERSRQGRLDGALVAYESLIATGDADASTYANAAELLMALGRLSEAEERYREAIRLDTPAPGRIETSHALTLATYGLAVALDRAGQADAAREMMARALVLDPRHATLTAAEQAAADVFFIPDGDVYYYLGLGAEVAGEIDESKAAFQEFVTRLPRGPWITRARAHLGALAALEASPRAARTAPALRIVAAGTVLADGPIPAPLVDAAWREHPALLDDCLAEAVPLAPRAGFRLALELTIDARGVVTEVAVKAPASLDASFCRCVERAVRAGLRISRPRRARPTRARLELLVAPLASNDAGGV